MAQLTRLFGAQDPREVLDWAVDWTAALQPGETITAVTWTIAPVGIGLVITPLSLVGVVAYARLEVASAQQTHARWNTPGVIVALTCEIATSGQREITRTIRVRMERDTKSPIVRIVSAE